jgi:hypothetical protein
MPTRHMVDPQAYACNAEPRNAQAFDMSTSYSTPYIYSDIAGGFLSSR